MNLRDLLLSEMVELLSELKQPTYRAKQLFEWVHKKYIDDLCQAKNLPQALCQKLNVETLVLAEKQLSEDGTVKYLWQLSDNNYIESVLLKSKDRYTACISSQVGCKMGCSFCVTARIGFIRQLTVGEIVSQIYQMEKDSSEIISNIVYMGMGEPLDNYQNVLKSIYILNDTLGKNIGQRKITVSTCGLIPQIKKFATENLQITLAVSINAANDDLRSQIMPVNKTYPLADLMDSLKYYSQSTGRRLSLEYVLQSGINDCLADALNLVKLVKDLNAHINLIVYNENQFITRKRSSDTAVKLFQKTLENNGLEVTRRYRKGADIQAACGQLSAGYQTS